MEWGNGQQERESKHCQRGRSARVLRRRRARAKDVGLPARNQQRNHPQRVQHDHTHRSPKAGLLGRRQDQHCHDRHTFEENGGVQEGDNHQRRGHQPHYDHPCRIEEATGPGDIRTRE